MNFIKGVGLYVGGMATGIGIGALGASIVIAVMLLDDKRQNEMGSSRVKYNSTYSKYYTDKCCTDDAIRRND